MALYHEQENYERKRSEQYHREKSKWDRLDAAHNKDEQRMAHLRDAGIGARRNQSSAAFNILTLQYDKSPKGQALAARVSDDVAVCCYGGDANNIV